MAAGFAAALGFIPCDECAVVRNDTGIRYSKYGICTLRRFTVGISRCVNHIYIPTFAAIGVVCDLDRGKRRIFILITIPFYGEYRPLNIFFRIDEPCQRCASVCVQRVDQRFIGLTHLVICCADRLLNAIFVDVGNLVLCVYSISIVAVRDIACTAKAVSL